MQAGSGLFLQSPQTSVYDTASGTTVIVLANPRSFVSSFDMMWATNTNRWLAFYTSGTGVQWSESGGSSFVNWAHAVPTGKPTLSIAVRSPTTMTIQGSWYNAVAASSTVGLPSYGALRASLGALTNGTFPTNSNIYQVLTWLRPLANSEVAAVVSYARSNWNLETINTTTNIVVDGDSITYGFGVGGNSGSWANIAATALGWTITNNAVSSATIGDPTSPVTNSVVYRRPLATAAAITLAKRNIYMCMIGVNDLSAQALSPAQICWQWENHILNMINLGFEVVSCTILPNNTGVDTESAREFVNTYIRKFASRNTVGFHLIDWAASNKTMGVKGAELNSTYYQGDAVHPTATGQSSLAATAQTLLAGWYP